jgi:hypothetical protein
MLDQLSDEPAGMLCKVAWGSFWVRRFEDNLVAFMSLAQAANIIHA